MADNDFLGLLAPLFGMKTIDKEMFNKISECIEKFLLEKLKRFGIDDISSVEVKELSEELAAELAMFEYPRKEKEDE